MTGLVHAVDPRTGQPLPDGFPEASAAGIAEAAERARAAVAPLAAAPPATVADLLRRIAHGLADQADEVIAYADRETALGTARLTGELARTRGQLDLFARLVEQDALIPEVVSALPDGGRLRRTAVPLGPVAVFAASNFPLAFSVAGTDTASALAARCPVVVKAHPAHPGTADLVAGIVHAAVAAAGLPAGVFTLLQGASPQVSAALVQAPQIAAVAFTGSTTVGRILADLAAARPHPIPVYAELGSVNPVIVTPAALATREQRDAVAGALAASVLDGWGQLCTKPGLIGVPADELGSFADALAEHMARVTAGHLLSASIRDHLVARVGRLGALDGVSARTAVPAAGSGLSHPALLLTARDCPQWSGSRSSARRCSAR